MLVLVSLVFISLIPVVDAAKRGRFCAPELQNPMCQQTISAEEMRSLIAEGKIKTTQVDKNGNPVYPRFVNWQQYDDYMGDDTEKGYKNWWNTHWTGAKEGAVKTTTAQTVYDTILSKSLEENHIHC